MSAGTAVRGAGVAGAGIAAKLAGLGRRREGRARVSRRRYRGHRLRRGRRRADLDRRFEGSPGPAQGAGRADSRCRWRRRVGPWIGSRPRRASRRCRATARPTQDDRTGTELLGSGTTRGRSGGAAGRIRSSASSRPPHRPRRPRPRVRRRRQRFQQRRPAGVWAVTRGPLDCAHRVRRRRGTAAPSVAAVPARRTSLSSATRRTAATATRAARAPRRTGSPLRAPTPASRERNPDQQPPARPRTGRKGSVRWVAPDGTGFVRRSRRGQAPPRRRPLLPPLHGRRVPAAKRAASPPATVQPARSTTRSGTATANSASSPSSAATSPTVVDRAARAKTWMRRCE